MVYTWDEFRFQWPLESMQKTGEHLAVKNSVENVITYRHYTFVTLNTPMKEVPFTLALINASSKTPELKPYPNWDYYIKRNCDDLVFVSSFTIDPETGYMWIVDTSAQDSTSGKCSPKILIYDIDNNKEVHRHVFPTIVIGQRSVFLNDIVLDHKGNETYAYITDALDFKMIAYNKNMDKSYYFTHPSMEPEPEPEILSGNSTMCNSTTAKMKLGISSVTISSDNEFIYYCTAEGLTIYQIQTSILRNQFSNSIRFASAVHEAGEKLSRGTGLVYNRDNELYYSSYESGHIYKWSVGVDAKKQDGFSMVTMETQSEIVSNSRWIQSLWLDNKDNLWFISNNFKCLGGFSNMSQSNYFVWRTPLNEIKYSVINSKNHSNNGGIHTSALDLLILNLAIFFFSFYFNS